MLNACTELVQQLQERRETELKPEEKVEEKVKKQAVEVADALSTEGITQAAGTLKSEIGKLLGQLSDRLEEETSKYRQVKKAVEVKEQELGEIYEIQKSASSLAALIEAQHQMREQFEAEMAGRKEALDQEIQTRRAEWEQEKKRHEAEIKERDTAEQKRREREKEEYLYAFQREQQLAKDQFQDQKGKLEREIQYKREEMERELAERERTIAQKEEELNDLRKRVAAFPKELESAVNKAVKEAVERETVQTSPRRRKERQEAAKFLGVSFADFAPSR
jgi:hypothetical protein